MKDDEDDDVIEDTEFTCPKCGSHTFGSSNCTGAFETMIGHCHGTYTMPEWGRARANCAFSWPRTDDAKYFRGLGTFRPRVEVAQVKP